MRSLETARLSWQEVKRCASLQELKEGVHLDGATSIATEGGRSACWKAFLLFDTLDVTIWQRTLTSSRSAYNSLCAHFLRSQEESEENDESYDPLSGDPEATPRREARQDKELRAEILQDVTRCMPENLYFRQPDTQRMLLDILFIFCKLNPDVSYRQGMHELLAPVLWVVERDAIDLGRSSKVLGEDAIMLNIFDPNHIEHDTFALFGEIMQSAKNFYEQSTTSGKENPMVRRSQQIFNELLPKVDEQLAQHLASIDIVPQVFLMRWIRLLFGREFTFDDMLTVWDIIFAKDSSLDIVNEICLAMILRIRWQLIEADYNEALTLLLHYPELEKDFPAQTLALDALYLRSHMDYHGGSYLVSKYSGRPIYQVRRPVTPPPLQRNITTISGAHSVANLRPLQSRAIGSARNIEKVFQSTAKDIYARGEKLGIGKVVRGAVDEVHRRAQEIRDAPTPSPPRTFHQQRRSQSSIGPFALQDRVKTLEDRSQQLAKLLEGALGELQEYQKGVVESEDANSGAELKPALEGLNMAIAKVQFVQVYLDDPKLLLPSDSNPLSSTSQPDSTDTGSSTRQQYYTPASRSAESGKSTIISSSRLQPGVPGLADPSSFEETDDSSTISVSGNPGIVVEDIPSNSDASRAHLDEPPKGETSSRPRLDQSSYSWMLDEPNATNRAQPELTSSSAATSARSKSFLFGEEKERTGGQNAESNSGFDITSLRHGKR